MKRILSFILALTLMLPLAACGTSSSEPEPSGTPTSAPAAEQTPTPDAPGAEPMSGEMPADEYERAVWYGFLPKQLEGCDPDDTAVTWYEYCSMLWLMLNTYDESLLPSWDEATKNAPDIEMKRDGAMVSLLFAAKAMGLATFNAQAPAAFFDYAGKVWDIVTLDYPVFDWDTPVDLGEGCSDSNHVGPAYDFCVRRVSAVSGKSLLDFDENGDLRLEQPLTLREALLSAVRLYESYIPETPYVLERAPTAEDEALLADYETRKLAILQSETDVTYTGTAYYVSNGGSDENDGLSPEAAWATLDRVNIAKSHGELQPGDAVFLERGGLWRGFIDCAEGVTYSAYGKGEKPRIYGSPENGGGADKWQLWHDENGVKIWKFYRDISEVGNIVMNGGEACALRVYAYYNGYEWVASPDDEQPFDVVQELTQDMQFYTTFDLSHEQYEKYKLDFGGFAFADMIEDEGPLYLRCDAGNPGELYGDIEFHSTPKGLLGYVGLVNPVGNNVIDNICIRYSLCNGIAIYDEDGGNDNNTIQNCEVGWIGGDQHDLCNGIGTVMVCGEAVVFKTSGNTFTNNYIHQAAQGSFVGEFIQEEWVDGATLSKDNTFHGNLVDKCQYGFWFWDNSFQDDKGMSIVFWDNTTISDNYVMYMGYGWYCDERLVFPGKVEAMNGAVENAWAFGIGGLGSAIRNMTITDNVFYLSRGTYLIQAQGVEDGNVTFSGNTYVQNDNRNMLWGVTPSSASDKTVLQNIQDYLGDKTAVVFPLSTVN